jgi:hypothetical protein
LKSNEKFTEKFLFIKNEILTSRIKNIKKFSYIQIFVWRFVETCSPCEINDIVDALQRYRKQNTLQWNGEMVKCDCSFANYRIHELKPVDSNYETVHHLAVIVTRFQLNAISEIQATVSLGKFFPNDTLVCQIFDEFLYDLYSQGKSFLQCIIILKCNICTINFISSIWYDIFIDFIAILLTRHIDFIRTVCMFKIRSR